MNRNARLPIKDRRWKEPLDDCEMEMAMRKKETDSGRQRRRKVPVYVEWRKKEILKWMREVEKRREIHRRRIKRMRECG